MKTNTEAYLVEIPGCRIPNLDPFDISVRHLIKPATIRTCLTDSNFTYVKNMTIYVNWSVIKFSNYHSTFSNCTFQSIDRPENDPGLSSDFVKVSNESKRFNTSIRYDSEFIRVKCFDITDKLMYTNFYCTVIEKPDSERRKTALQESSRKKHPNIENFNVLLIGIDSVSRLNSIRYMNKTRSFLLNTLNATELIGYNKVADNTFVNIIPMIAGKFVEELPWDESMIHDPFDEYQFIWKDFASRGYRTLFVEDAPEMAMFDFMKGGFKHAPTDYYNRHFALTMEEGNEDVWFDDHQCIVDKLETKLYLDYVRDFVALMKDKPHFGFSFMTRLTHTGSIEDVGAADDSLF
ncbi:hypothetical protein FSP39_013317 [Pinctada imbricata]|uniref:Uncharacterized protein n=1 Tax=Pinctada imbricata TaxID=66713 RepID=A0AA88Y7C9_PINIB|nr:hypothetical protein FSP39_013317 [Pinctada imbricata]